MSKKYKDPSQVPTAVLIDRLQEIADLIKDGARATLTNEMTMRIPAEVDRDMDIVLTEVIKRLSHLSLGESKTKIVQIVIGNNTRIFGLDSNGDVWISNNSGTWSPFVVVGENA